MEEFEIFKRICGEYEGKLVEEENCISFTARNKVASYFQDGSVHNEKVVECRLRVQVYESEEKGKWISLQGEEETYSILGGFSNSFSEQSLRYNLKRYNFKPKGKAQMNLFDLI